MDVDNMTATEMDQKAATRSCTTCSKAKAKCVRRPGQEICERYGYTTSCNALIVLTMVDATACGKNVILESLC